MKKPHTFNIILGAILLLILINSLFLGRLIAIFSDKVEDAEERARPAELNITSISDSSCETCFNIDTVLDQIKSGNVTVNNEKKLDVSDAEAQEYIELYGIEKIPTFIVEGETRKDESMIEEWEKIGEIKGDTFVFTQVSPPYHEVSSGNIRGIVNVTVLKDESCEECFNSEIFKDILASFGIPTNNISALDISSPEGSELAERYEIVKVPAFVISEEAKAYTSATAAWNRFGTVEDDGTYVFRNPEIIKGASFKEL